MLIEVNYPDGLGGQAPCSNSGNLKSKGGEAVLGYRNHVGDLSYNVSFNIGDSRNEVIEMEGVSTYSAGNNKTVQGCPIDSLFMFKANGFFQDQAGVDALYSAIGGDVPSASDLTQRLRPGDTKKVDVDGDGAITDTGNIGEM